MNNLTRRNNNNFDRFRDDFFSTFDDLFRNFNQSSTSNLGRNENTHTPQMALREKEEAYILEADLPGLDREDINIEVRNDNLIIEGERSYESSENEGAELKHYEMQYGSFRRSIPLGDDIDREKISAKLKNGCLRIELGKSQDTHNKNRKIDVQ